MLPVIGFFGTPESMFSAIKRLLSSRDQGKSEDKNYYAKDGQLFLNGESFPRGIYYETGIPAYSLDDLMQHQEIKKLINGIHQGLPIGKEEFERLLLPVIRNAASYMHCLPASENHHHCSPLGLLTHSLQVATYAMNTARSRYFQTGTSPRQVRDNELRWHVAAALGGLLHDAGKPFTDYAVTDNKGNIWRATTPLSTWLAANKASSYSLSWNRERNKLHEKETKNAAFEILTPEIKEFLMLHGRGIYLDLTECLGGATTGNTLYSIVNEADKLSTSKDIANNKLAGPDSKPLSTEVFIFEAIRSLLVMGRWEVNSPGARVLVIKNHGVFIDMDRGAASLAGAIRSTGRPSVPQDSGAIATLLIERGYLVPFATVESRKIWNWDFRVKFDNKLGSVVKEFSLLKLASGHYIFDRPEPVEIEAELISTNPNDPGQDEKAPTAANAKSSAGKKQQVDEAEIESDTESDTESTDRPRDFEQLMTELQELEGEFQPVLQQEKAEAEAARKPDAAADISRSLCEKLGLEAQKEDAEEEADVVPANTGETEGKPHSNEDKADPVVAVEAEQVDAEAEPEPTQDEICVPSEDTRALESPQVQGTKENPGAQNSSAAPVMVDMLARLMNGASQVSGSNAVEASFGPSNSVAFIEAKPEQPVAEEAEAAADSSSQEARAQASTGKKKRKKKRKLSIREEMARDAILIERENRREERLTSEDEFTPKAIAYRAEKEQGAQQPVQQAAEGFSCAPPAKFLDFDSVAVKAKPARGDAQTAPRVGPSPNVNSMVDLREAVKPEPKLRPEKHNRPKIHIENEKKAQKKKAYESLSLQQKLKLGMKGVVEEAVNALAGEVQKVLDREVPLGVTMRLTQHGIRFEQEAIEDSAREALCKHPCCDTESDGGLILTDNLMEIIQGELELAQQKAKDEADAPTPENVTGNVNLRDQQAGPVAAQSGAITPRQAIEMLLEQARVGYGSLLDAGARLEGDTMIVGIEPTYELIRKSYPYLTRSSLRNELKKQGFPSQGKQIQIKIGD